MKSGFTLIEVLIATILLSVGLLTILASMQQIQKMMLASKRYELCQKVLGWGEMLYPIPDPDDVTDDPLKNERLNISETRASELANDLEIELTRQQEQDLEGYTFERAVDEIDDEVLERLDGIYTIRTIVRWGGDRRGGKRDEETVIRFWRKSSK